MALSAALLSCKVTPSSMLKGGDGGAADAASASGSDDSGTSSGTVMDLVMHAPEAKQAGKLTLDEPVTDVVYAGDLALSLHSTSGVSILDLSDPSAPAITAKLPTTGRAVAVAFEAELRILYIITVSGDLRAYHVANPAAPVQASQSTITEPNAKGDTIAGLARVGGRLFVLGKTQLIPVNILYGANGSVGFLAQTAVKLAANPLQLSTGGDALYIAFKGGIVQVWSSAAAPTMLDQASLGTDIVGWVVRGSHLFVALKGQGLRVVDMTVKGSLKVLFDAPELKDLSAVKRFGNLVLVALSGGTLVAFDLSVLDAPRALVKRSGTLPDWIAPVGGNLLLGTGKQLSVFGVPPFVAASVPQAMRASFPRYGQIPLQLSKPVDPRTITVSNIKLLCGTTAVVGTVVISLDGLHITFLPKSTLPAGVDCKLTLGGVKDALGLGLSAPQVAPALTFHTAAAVPAAVDNNKSKYKHTADGEFTDWTAGKTKDFEYFDVTGAHGMYSYFYADHDGTRLWMLNDWFYNGDQISPDCYNQFGVWTGGGSERWEIRAYGDQHVEVRLNGSLLAKDDKRVTGGYGHSASPNQAEPHTVYEISIATAPGAWGVQLHDPGPTFGCEQLETDPTNYTAKSTATGSSIDPTKAPSVPPKPQPATGQSVVSTDGTVLSWASGDAQGTMSFASYLLEIASGKDLSTIVYRTWVYGPSLTLPAGLLQDGMTYTWRVTAYTVAGSTASDPVTFTVGKAVVAVGAPGIDSVKPTTITQSTNQGLIIMGSGFVKGAKAYFNNVALNTTFVSSTQLMAMLGSADDATVGTFAVAVRNVPGDDQTKSNNVKVTVHAATSSCSHLECIPGNRLASDCSACATAVCGAHQNCCAQLWDAACVNAAATTQACGCSAPTLTSVGPTSVTTSVDTMVTAVMTGAPAGETYTLLLAPMVDGGGVSASFSCVSTVANSCTAVVNVPNAGNYDVKVRVGGASAIDTNTLSSAITVGAAPVCGHSECVTGAELQTNCSTCATNVCANTPACCSSGWGNNCVLIADSLKSCTCVTSGVSTRLPQNALSATGQIAGASTPVTVTIQNGLVGVTYALALSPNNGGNSLTFPCTPNQAVTSCDTTVSGVINPGIYYASIRMTSGATTVDGTGNYANTFTVTTACPHSECLPGARTGGSSAQTCSPCAAAVCATIATCCTTSWDASCVAAAAVTAACSYCKPPTLSQLNTSGGQSGANLTPVKAFFNNGGNTVAYDLVLTPHAGGNELSFACAYGGVIQTYDTCDATVTGLAATTDYDVKLRATATVNQMAVPYDTNTLSSAFTTP